MYAEGDGPQPDELETLRLIDRFGVKAILGRDVLNVVEVRRMLASENVYTAKQGSSAAENIAEWAAHNPRLARILTWAEKSRAEIDTDGE